MSGMTIKQLADEIGVSKTAIRKYLTEEFRENYVETAANGVITISETGCGIISANFRKHENVVKTTANQFAENTENTENITIPIMVWNTLQKQLEEKDQQLKEKDRQLAVKDEQINNLTEANKAQAQSINADRHNELLETAQLRLEAPGKKDGWFSRIFGRNKE